MFTIREGWNTGVSESMNIYHGEQFVACVMDRTGSAQSEAQKVVDVLNRYNVQNYKDLRNKLPYNIWFTLISNLNFSEKWV